MEHLHNTVEDNIHRAIDRGDNLGVVVQQVD